MYYKYVVPPHTGFAVPSTLVDQEGKSMVYFVTHAPPPISYIMRSVFPFRKNSVCIVRSNGERKPDSEIHYFAQHSPSPTPY